MEPKELRFIYQAMNLLASGKFDPETEHCLADAIARELFAINPHLAGVNGSQQFYLPDPAS